MDAPPVRWGVLGTGMIAGTFTSAVRAGTQSTVSVVGSRSPDRAQGFAAEHAVGRAVDSYDELVAADDVDIVYVASPHSEHHAHAMLALAAGKPVLVEKAFTRNAAEAQDVVTAADGRGLLCMEAMWSRFLPHFDVVRQVIETGLLGSIRMVVADHGQRLWPDGPQRLADPTLAGGSLLDLGIYPVSFAHFVLGALQDVHAVATLTDQGVDASVGIVAQGPGGGIAMLNATMAARTPTTACIAGELGRVEIDGGFYGPTAVRLLDHEDTVRDVWPDDPALRHHGLKYEAAEAARCLEGGHRESALLPTSETVAIMAVLDEVRRQVGVRYPGE